MGTAKHLVLPKALSSAVRCLKSKAYHNLFWLNDSLKVWGALRLVQDAELKYDDDFYYYFYF